MGNKKHKKPRSKFKSTMMKNKMVRSMANNPMAEVIGWGAWVVLAIVVVALVISFVKQ